MSETVIYSRLPKWDLRDQLPLSNLVINPLAKGKLSNTIMSRIEKTIARQKERSVIGDCVVCAALCARLLTIARIEEGQFYEAHQQLRVITSRYVKSSDYTSAISVLFGGAQLLLKAGQGASGGDLCLFLLDVYNKAELKPDAASKGRLLTLLRAFPQDELPIKKKFVAEMVAWSARWGEYPAGDPELHHVAGQLYAEGMA